MKRHWDLPLLLFLVYALSGTLAEAQEPIRIGVPLALTGPLAVNGEDNRKGSLLYLAEIGYHNLTPAGRRTWGEVKTHYR